jgi:hypothetical protein
LAPGFSRFPASPSDSVLRQAEKRSALIRLPLASMSVFVKTIRSPAEADGSP